MGGGGRRVPDRPGACRQSRSDGNNEDAGLSAHADDRHAAVMGNGADELWWRAPGRSADQRRMATKSASPGSHGLLFLLSLFPHFSVIPADLWHLNGLGVDPAWNGHDQCAACGRRCQDDRY